MRTLSVCSGGGLLDYGLSRAGFDVVAHCEAEAYPRQVLERHAPGLPMFTDLRTLRGHQVPAVDCIVGGIPCQPASVAGLGLGDADPRWLWPDFLRLLGETRAGFGLIENVAGLFSNNGGRLFGLILREAVDAGYSVEWQLLAAATLGACHIRRRVFIVLRRDDRLTWEGPLQVGLFGRAPLTVPSGGWPSSGCADRRGWAATPQRWPEPGVWPWLQGEGREMVPTPNASLQNYDEDPEQWETRRAQVQERLGNGNGVGLPLGQWAMRRMLPTPAVGDVTGSRAVPEGTSDTGRRPDGTKVTIGLAEAVRRMLPTPDVGSVIKAALNTNQASVVKDGLHGRLPGGVSGKLRPQPVEWMMGVPDGWTLPDGPSLMGAEPPQQVDWPGCAWTTSEQEDHRRHRLKVCGNGVYAPAAEAVGVDLMVSVGAVAEVAK